MPAKKYITTWRWQLAVWWQEHCFRIAWANTNKPDPGSGWKNIWLRLWITKTKG